jgi:hypothetical protein
MTHELLLSILGLSVAIATLFIAIGRLWAAIYPIWLEHKNRFLLKEKFSRGPYDKATIEQSSRYYIKPKCSNIDPTQEKELRHALVATREDLFEKVDYFLDHDDSLRHLLILADSGMGKTSFVLNYYTHNATRPKKMRHRLALVPLGVKDADELIAAVPDQEYTVIFLDAFDEDVKAVADYNSRIRTLMDKCRKYKRVIITCRTQFFARDEEIPVETGIVRIGPRKAGEKGTYEFWKLYLSPFDDREVDQYLIKRYPVWFYYLRRRARKILDKIPLLSVRPMLLAYIPDVVASAKKIRHSFQLYEEMVDAWLVRESYWCDKKALREFSEQLAVNLYLNREDRGMERIPPSELSKLAKEWGISLDQWRIRVRSLLNRDPEGNCKFAHRSIMEHLFVQRLVNGDRRCYGIDLTDQMKEFLIEILGIKVENLRSVYKSLMQSEVIAYGVSTTAELESSAKSIDMMRSTILEIMQKQNEYLDKTEIRNPFFRKIKSLHKKALRLNAEITKYDGIISEPVVELFVEIEDLLMGAQDQFGYNVSSYPSLYQSMDTLLAKIIQGFGLKALELISIINLSTDLRIKPILLSRDRLALKLTFLLN